MFKNHLKTAWRSGKRNKVYSFINVLGLTLGLCACMIVGTVVLDDLSYDKQWSRADDIYRIITVNKMGNDFYDRFPSSFAGLLPVLNNDYPEVESAGMISPGGERLRLNENDSGGVIISTLMADTSFWKMLDIEVVAGSPQTHIAGQKNLIITESFRNKYFKNEDPVGKIIKNVPTYQTKATPYLITGIIKDLPSNSVMRADALIVSSPYTETLNKQGYGTFLQSYVLFKPDTDITTFTKKLNDWYHDYTENKVEYEFELQPLKEVYLHSDFSPSQTVKGDYKTLVILIVIALLLLTISCVNFVNLSTAKAIFRLKESGIRKILGADRKQLMSQFFTETTIFFFISMLLAFLTYSISIPWVENFLEYPLAIHILKSVQLLSATIAGVFLLSIMVGIYPAWVLSGFNPAATLKGKLFAGKQASRDLIKKTLVVVQFGITIVVLIALIVVQNQLSFMRTTDLGFDKENLLSISSINWNGKGETIKQEIEQIPGVESAAITTWNGVGDAYMSRNIENPEKPGEKVAVWYINGDANFAQTIGLKLEAGRFLDPSLHTDAVPPDSAQVNMKNRSAVLTQQTAKLLRVQELNQPLQNVFVVPVGIVRDFNSESLRSQIKPTIITAEDSLRYGYMTIRVLPGTDLNVTRAIQGMWKDFFPENLLAINRVDEMVARQYKAEEKLGKIFSFFSTLTMLLAILGIFGLIMQTTAQRTKEIGIRKVLGASIDSILKLFSLDFAKLILIALLLASPVAWWLMNRWLQDYAYRITIQWWMFAIAGLMAMITALLTISLQTLKAARANPAESLRDE